jgi:hypothetical protein
MAPDERMPKKFIETNSSFKSQTLNGNGSQNLQEISATRKALHPLQGLPDWFSLFVLRLQEPYQGSVFGGNDLRREGTMQQRSALNILA